MKNRQDFSNYVSVNQLRQELETEIFDKILNNKYIPLSLIEELNQLNSDYKEDEFNHPF
jgi:hypothetical protein